MGNFKVISTSMGKIFEYNSIWIDSKKYFDKKALGLNDEEIFLDYGVSLADIIKKTEKKAQEEKAKYPKINNMHELATFIYDKLLSPEERQYIKKNSRKGMEDLALITLFPERFLPILKLKYAQDSMIKLDKQNEIKSLAKYIGKTNE